MRSKQQIVHIGGGEAFNSHEQYLSYLKTVPLYHLESGDFSPWYKSIDQELDSETFEYIKIPMPCAENAKYQEWKLWFDRHIPYFKDNLIFIGHSLGGVFLAKYLSENELKLQVKQLHLLAAPFDFENDIEQLNDFKLTEFPKDFFNNEIEEVHIYHSQDDDVVPFSESQKYHQALPEAQLHIFEDRGHFLGETFPELFGTIKKPTEKQNS